jgi:iron(III) transport system substrate-binding protein
LAAFRNAFTGAFVLAIIVSSYLFAGQVSHAQEMSAVEKIYADLAKLPSDERMKRIEEGARREGKLVLVHTLRGELGNGHIALFKKRYPFLKVEATADIGSQDAAERLYAEETSGRHITDVIGISVADGAELLSKNYVARYPTNAASRINANLQKFNDPQGRWLLFFWSEHGISYNTNLVPANKAPKDWFDLCDPMFKGSVSFDPAEVRFVTGIYNIMGEEKALKWFECIGANNPIIQRGHSQRVELMLMGDHMVQGDNYLYHGLAIKRKNPAAPYAIVLDTPIIAGMGASFINRNAADPYAAALWTEWSVTEESQKYISDQLRGPVTLPHPYLPDNVNLVGNEEPPKEVTDRLMAAWMKLVEKKR